MRTWRCALLAVLVASLASCAGDAPMTLDGAATAAGIDPEHVVPFGDGYAAAVASRGGRVELHLFTRDIGWVQDGGGGGTNEVGAARVGMIGWSDESEAWTVLFGAGPQGLHRVTSEDEVASTFGVSDPAATTWFLAVPTDDGAAISWTAWAEDGKPLLRGRGLALRP
jgi:hypothetical protein